MKALLSTLARVLAAQTEYQERLLLLNRPWEEDFLHWAWDGERRVLHGHLVPPAGRRRHSVTRSGWCPGQLGQARHVVS